MLRYEGTIKLAVLINLSLALVAALAIPPRRVALAIVAGVSLTLAAFVFRPQPPEALLRVSPVNDFRAGEILFYDVGRSATVLVMEHDGFLYLRTNGLPEASIDVRGAPPARNSQRLLAVLPVLAWRI